MLLGKTDDIGEELNRNLSQNGLVLHENYLVLHENYLVLHENDLTPAFSISARE